MVAVGLVVRVADHVGMSTDNNQRTRGGGELADLLGPASTRVHDDLSTGVRRARIG
jgi:hypothetical protein